jgi:hypothetical protein
VNSLDFDLDGRISNLELEWRQAYETGIAARAALQALAAIHKPDASAVAQAHSRLDLAESLKACIMAKIERLEDSILGHC